MAWLTKVRTSPAEPLRNRAAKPTLVLYEFRAMLRASLLTSTTAHSSATSADELLLLEVVVVVSSLARFSASKVGFLTLEAHVVRQDLEGVSLQRNLVIGV